jgi:SNF2 family DNA or RNA helicase
MNLTDYHAKYLAHELTKRCASDNLEKLAGALVDAQVDLNPHRVEAALFAFKSPLSKGAIFADEVGLGKTCDLNWSHTGTSEQATHAHHP